MEIRFARTHGWMRDQASSFIDRSILFYLQTDTEKQKDKAH